MTRSEQTARQLHLSRGVYPVHYPEPRGVPEGQWQIDVDNRIRYGLGNALKLGIIKPDATIMAVQGWKGGLGHTNTLRILSYVPLYSIYLEEANNIASPPTLLTSTCTLLITLSNWAGSRSGSGSPKIDSDIDAKIMNAVT